MVPRTTSVIDEQRYKTEEFCKFLWGDYIGGFFLVSRDARVRKAAWCKRGQFEWPQTSPHWHVYFSVNPVDVELGANQRATNETVAATRCFFIDVDGKDEVLPDEYAPFLPPNFDTLSAAEQRTSRKAAQEAAMMADLPRYKQRAFERVQNSPLAPSVIVDSGGGYQVYWLLAEPVILNESNRSKMIALYAAWVDLCGGDPAAKDLARVLRLPDSFNVKERFDEYPRVAFVEFDMSLRYDLADFERLTGVDDIWMAAQKAEPPQRKEKDAEGVIAQFNAVVRVGDLLTQYGYLLGGTQQNTARYSRPGREKAQTSVMVWLGENRSYHHSSSDPLYCDAHSRDAFSVFTDLEHGGDAKAAYIAAKKMLGLWDEQTQAKQQHGAGKQYSNGLPEIGIDNRQLRDVLADAKNALETANVKEPKAPVIYAYAGGLARVSSSTKIIESLNNNSLIGILAACANWGHWKNDKDGNAFFVNKFPTRDIAGAFLGLGEWPSLPPLKGIITAPTFVDGRWVLEAGFDAESGLYLTDNVPVGDTTPTPERVAWAIAMLLGELLCDFPFANDASRAHALALLLLPFVRHIIDGATPLHLIDAPEKGTGKGLLASACCYPALGGDIPSTAAGRDDDEWRKRITSELKKGGSHINFDNVAGTLDSPSFALALTQAIWADRELGQSRMVHLPVKVIWAATGNNIHPSDEIARRCAWIRLDANTERPQERTGFRHADLRGWAKTHRSELVTAAIVLVNNWVALGKPKGNYVKGSFQEWAAVMGGILDAAGVPGFLANERELFDSAVSELGTWAAFVDAWAEKHHELWVTAKELFPIASHYDDSPVGEGLLDSLLGASNERSRQIKLGKQLGGMADRVINGWKITRGNLLHGYQQWRLVKVGEPQTGRDTPSEAPSPDNQFGF